jgi:hypothetical protein
LSAGSGIAWQVLNNHKIASVFVFSFAEALLCDNSLLGHRLIAALGLPSFVAGRAVSLPVIYYVSPINRNASTYIFIFGKGFEPSSIGPYPQPVAGPYTGLDFGYFACLSYLRNPSLGIADLNQGWNAGGYYESGSCGDVTVDGYTFSGWSQIGFTGLAWSDNQITLTGFGNGLPAAGFHIHTGDRMLVAVLTAYGTAWAVTTYTGPSF